MDCGRKMDLDGRVSVRCLLSDFPGYGVFRHGGGSPPLAGDAQLLPGQLYYLLPLRKDEAAQRLKPVRVAARKSADLRAVEVLPSPGKGVGRVKAVIGRNELAEGLSEQVNMAALVERTRLAVGLAHSRVDRLC